MSVNSKYPAKRKYSALGLLAAYMLILGILSFHHHPIKMSSEYSVTNSGNLAVSSQTWHCSGLHIAADSFQFDFINTTSFDTCVSEPNLISYKSSDLIQTSFHSHNLRGPPVQA